ncbi:MAG: hypothetical protein IPK82_14745 [Polyangiaceae bacterium]|nr:hypothetical protein [Polyangiaceae bacterium]
MQPAPTVRQWWLGNNNSPAEQAKIYLSERGPTGEWTSPQDDSETISFPPTAYEPRPIFFPNGDRLVVWNQWMSTGYGVAVAEKRAQQNWQFPTDADDVLSQHYLFSNAPNPAVNAQGDLLISWYQSGGGSLLAWQSERFGYNGTLSHPGPNDFLSVADTPVDSHPVANPKPALAPNGEAAVVWTQENGKGSVVVYAAFRDSKGVWTKPENVDDTLSPRFGYARCPQVAFAPTGDLFVVWYQDTGAGNRVFAAHRAPDGTWVEPGREPTMLSNPGSEAIYPSLAVGERGGVIAVWTQKTNSGWEIVARRRGPVGVDWGPIEVLSSGQGGSAAQPDVAIGGPDEVAVVGWTQGEVENETVRLAVLP